MARPRRRCLSTSESGQAQQLTPLGGASSHADQIDDEHECLVGADDAARAAFAIREHWRNREPTTTPHLHTDGTLVPAGDDIALAKAEFEGLATVPRRIELPSGLPRDANVVDLHD